VDENNKKWNESTPEENHNNDENTSSITNNKDSDTALHIFMQQSYASKLLG